MPQPQYNAPAPQKSNTLKIVLIVLGVVLGMMILGCGILAALLFPAVSAARQAAQRQMASNNLKQIGLAFHNYEATYKKLPASHGINHENKPTGNWRIVISPFVEQVQVYEHFDFKKPWDAPENQRVAGEMPMLFRSPLADPNQPPNQTNIFTVQDPRAVLPPGAVYRKFSEVLDGLSNTILAIELPNHSIPWTQPNDLTLPEALQLIRANKQPELVQILMLDGSITNVGKLTDLELTNLFTINDGTRVEIPFPGN